MLLDRPAKAAQTMFHVDAAPQTLLPWILRFTGGLKHLKGLLFQCWSQYLIFDSVYDNCKGDVNKAAVMLPFCFCGGPGSCIDHHKGNPRCTSLVNDAIDNQADQGASSVETVTVFLYRV